MIGLVIGGTGSLGKKLVPLLCRAYDRVRVLSRDEHKQIRQEHLYSNVDWFIGDVRDRDRVKLAAKGVSHVYHLAAVKSVDKAEYNPNEAVATNIYGTQNVVAACLENGVQRAIFTSTDKAVEPLNIYGSTKLAAEKIWIQSNCYSGREGTRFACMRYGNVLGSNGSVLDKWKRMAEDRRPLQITDPEMTRFFMFQEDAAKMVIHALNNCLGGEIFIPKMKSVQMGVFAEVFCRMFALDSSKIETIGIRPGEKIHETLISRNEIDFVTDRENMFVRYPSHDLFSVHRMGAQVDREIYGSGFTSYNAQRYSESEMKDAITRAIQS